MSCNTLAALGHIQGSCLQTSAQHSTPLTLPNSPTSLYLSIVKQRPAGDVGGSQILYTFRTTYPWLQLFCWSLPATLLPRDVPSPLVFCLCITHSNTSNLSVNLSSVSPQKVKSLHITESLNVWSSGVYIATYSSRLWRWQWTSGGTPRAHPSQSCLKQSQKRKKKKACSAQ